MSECGDMDTVDRDAPTNQPSTLGQEPDVSERAMPSARELDVDECWNRLREKLTGRLAVVVDRHPDIVPVNYLVDGGMILFRTGSGRKVPGTHGQVVAFEVDGWDERAGELWSVVVRGRARKAREPWELLHAQRLSLASWHPGDKPWFVVIEPRSITGRIFAPARSSREGI